MSILNIVNLKINNILNDEDSDIRIIDEPILSWDVDNIDDVSIEDGEISSVESINQQAYEIRISNYKYKWGTNSFIGNRVNTGYIDSSNNFWRYRGYPLERGEKYYGQIKIKDKNNFTSTWLKFIFSFNSLPIILNLSIYPSFSNINNNLFLSYDFYDMDGDVEDGTIIKWYKNGVYQEQFNNLLQIDSDFLAYDDVWYVEVLPSDGYEYGKKYSTPMVKIDRTIPVLSSIQILPSIPNELDVLKADYVSDEVVTEKDVEIRWYINDILQFQFDNSIYIRPDVEAGDVVRYEIKPKNGYTFYSSPNVIIRYSSFLVYNINIDGQKEPLDVSTITPIISWQVHTPYADEVNYTSIKIGTFYEADDVFSTTIIEDIRNYKIPYGILKKGIDYYISISSNSIKEFNNYICSHFRINGSRWEENVNNSTGYTIQSMISVPSLPETDETDETDETEVDKFNIIRIQDGQKFFDVRIYSDKIGCFSGPPPSEGREGFAGTSGTSGSIVTSGGLVKSENIDLSKLRILTIVGKQDLLKIYIDNECVIEEDLYQSSSEKRFEIKQGTINNLNVLYKNIRYTTNGAYYPELSDEYSDYKFHELFNFKNNECVSLKGNYNSKKVFGLNPDNDNISGKIYSITNDNNYKATTVAKTLLPINNIKASPDGKHIVFAHSKGITIIQGYIINNYNHSINFTDGNLLYPDDNGWGLITNIKREAAYFDSNGFNLNTIDKNI